MEFDAANYLFLTVLLLVKCSRHHIDRANLLRSHLLLAAKHLKVVLEHIDNLIGLEGLLNAEAHAVNEFVKLIVNCSAAARLLLDLVNEVTWLVLDAGVHRSIEVGLRVKSPHLICSLEAHLQDLLGSASLNRTSRFLNEFQVNGRLCRLFVDQLDVF